MGPLGGFLDLRSAIGVAVGGGWVFRVFIGSWVDYRDVYYESSFWLGQCEVGAYLAPGGGVRDDGFDGDRARLGVADECCEGLNDAVVSSSPGCTVQAAAEGMEWVKASTVFIFLPEIFMYYPMETLPL